MTDNPTRGVARLALKGLPVLTFQFPWDSLAELEISYGLTAPSIGEPKVLADVALIGLRVHHPDMTLEKLTALNVPMFPLYQAVFAALQYAYHGADIPPELAEGKMDAAKKKPTLWRTFLAWLSAWALRRQSSGN